MEKTVRVHDRDFDILINKSEIQKRIKELGEAISVHYQKKTTPVIISVLHGAVIFSSDLVREISIPVEMDFVRIKSYSGLESTGKVLMTQQWERKLKDREVLIVEDIIDTGSSIDFLKKKIEKAGALDVKIATLLFKPQPFKYEYSIDWIGFEIGRKFVVGFGLDYDGIGRNLPAIYQLKTT